MRKQVRYWVTVIATLLNLLAEGSAASVRIGPESVENRAFTAHLNHHRRGLRQDELAFEAVTKIVGGAEVRPGAYKFIASLRYPEGHEKSGTHYCGGSLIASNIVVTAAHCVKPLRGKNINVHLGRSDREGNDTVNFESYRTIEMRIHPSYNKYTNFNFDIALLILDGKTSITPVVMRRDDKCFEQNASCGYADVFGWGLTDPNQPDSYSSALMSLRVPLVEKQKCLDMYSNSSVTITDNMVCAGGIVGQDACGGDSGGPLLINNQLSGIVSFGPKKCGSELPGVFSSISYFFDWIEDHLVDINGVGLSGTPSASPVPSPAALVSRATSEPKTCYMFRFGRLLPYKC